jgi:putative peptide zinc metalloprotease protein
MGVGIYIVWPAFYTDITDAYRLRKWGRLRTDIGGMYFNMIFALGMGAVYALTGFEAILLLIVVQTFAVIQQSLPFLRLDGYYIISDLTGVPDILMRIKPVLASLVPGRKADDRVTELKPWVRAVVTTYIALLVPLLALMFTLMVINAPRLFATGWDSFWTHYDKVGPAFDSGQALRGVQAGLQMVVLALPGIGFAYTAARIAARGGTGAWRWSAGSPVRRAGVTLAGAAVVGAIAFTWWPNGEYRPIQPGERGTITGGLMQLSRFSSGRASLTPERQRQLGGAPTQRQLSKPSGGAKPQTTPGAKRKSATRGSIGAASQKPAPAGTAPAGGQAQTTPQASAQPASPQPGTTTPAPAQDQQQTPTDPSATSAPPPDQSSTQPQQPPPAGTSSGGTQMSPTTPTSP